MKKAVNPENPKTTPDTDSKHYMNFIETKFGRKDGVDPEMLAFLCCGVSFLGNGEQFFRGEYRVGVT